MRRVNPTSLTDKGKEGKKSAAAPSKAATTAALQFRRHSISMGVAPQAASLELPAMGEQFMLATHNNTALGSWYSEAEVAALANGFMSSVASKGHINSNIEAWYENSFPTTIPVEEQRLLTKRVLVSVAEQVKPLQKLGMIGLGTRLLFVLVLSYGDMITDVLIAFQFRSEGKVAWFNMSFVFLATAAFFHAVFGYISFSKRAMHKRMLKVISALLLLSPLIDGYAVWSGVDKGENDVFDPIVNLAASRFIELIGESIPESILQIHIVFCSNDEDVTLLQRLSICSSLVAGAFTVREEAATNEASRARMRWLI